VSPHRMSDPFAIDRKVKYRLHFGKLQCCYFTFYKKYHNEGCIFLQARRSLTSALFQNFVTDYKTRRRRNPKVHDRQLHFRSKISKHYFYAKLQCRTLHGVGVAPTPDIRSVAMLVGS
jgi:hydroxypyruvate isomerase